MPTRAPQIVEFPLNSRARKVGKVETVTHTPEAAGIGARREREKPGPVDVGVVLRRKILLLLDHEKETGGAQNVRQLMEELLSQTDLQERYEAARAAMPK